MKKIILLLLLLLGGESYCSDSGSFAAGNLRRSSSFAVESGISGVVTLSIPEISLSNHEQDKFFDSFFYRHNQFIFGRRGNRLYFNFFDGKRWTAYIDSDADFALEANRIYQLAFTLQMHEVRSQGELWTDVVLYADGREVGRARVLDRKPAASKAPVQFAQANGFGNGWNCAGKFYSRQIFNQTLDPEIIAETASKEKRIKFIPDGVPELPETVKNKISAFKKKFSLNVQGSDKAFVNAATIALQCWAHQCNEKQFDQLLRSLAKTFNVKKRIVCPEWNLLVSKQTIVILSAHDNRILAWYDLKNDKNLLDSNNTAWFQASYFKNGKQQTVSAVLSQVRLSAKNKPLLSSGKYSWKTSYQHNDFTAQVHYSYANDSLRYRLSLKAAPGIKLYEVTYPYVKLAPKKAGDLLIPCMSGAVKHDAAAKRITYSGYYPSGHVSMQLGAYYDKQSGIYFATEDERARAKSLLFRAGKNGLEIAYRWPVKYPENADDKSYFVPECDAVFSWFTGDWYDAGLLYKDFLERSAIWYQSARPVTEYPEWFKNNTLWLVLNHRDDSADKLAWLREYFELPFAVHYYNWFGKFDRDYPHHRANPQHYLWMQAIKRMDINIIPYTNGRLWETLDKRDMDFRYTSSGKPDAVKLANGTVQTENYNSASFAVMCSACPNWQNELKNLAGRVLRMNVDGMYMDQIGAARPRLCFDKTHPHAPNDPDSWYMAGYRKMLLDLHTLYPQAVWTTEDNAEPYVGLMHGLLSWRWMVDGNVPLFNLLYHGKTEMVGRAFGGDTPLSRKVKIYQQLLQGEQLGWCGVDFISQKNQADFRLLVKQAMHLRLGLLNYFQQGTLLRSPIIKNIQYRNLKWGNFADQVVSTPDVTASAWSYGNTQIILLVNQSEKVQSFMFTYPVKNKWSFTSISSQGKCKRKKQDFAVTLPVGDIAIILSGTGDDFIAENNRIKFLFDKINKFEKR